jgi:glycosyltransferase involved in cell wall biosynthesis
MIFDDCSPKISEIEGQLFGLLSTQPMLKLVKGVSNLGYDANLLNSIINADGDFVFLLSDDDSLEVGALNSVVASLETSAEAVLFTRFVESLPDDRSNQTSTLRFRRSWSTNQRFEPEALTSNGSTIYNAILFSGLIFKKTTVASFNQTLSEYLHSIYIQVAIFALLTQKTGARYIAGPGVLLGGDGENGFGTNASSVGDQDLADRSSIHSNLKYNKRLLKVIESLGSALGEPFIKSFYDEFNFRSISGMRHARNISRNDLLLYWKQLGEMTKFRKKRYFFIFLVIYLFPASLNTWLINTSARLVDLIRSKRLFN